MPEVVYDSSNTSSPVYSLDFNYGLVKNMSEKFVATQGAVQANSAAPNTILLRLPIPLASAANPEAAIMDLVGRFNYLGPADPSDVTSTVLGMYGGIEGVEPAPGSPAADLNFYLFIEPDPANQWVEGGAVIGDTYYRFETIDGAVIITAFPFEVGLCRLQQAGAAPVPGPGGWKNMTKAERRQYKQAVKEQKKLGRAQKRADAKDARAQKKVDKGGKRHQLRQRQLAKPAPQQEHQHHQHANHAHDDHAHVMHRHLQTGRLLVLLDFAPPSGFYRPWNQGNSISIVQCPATVFTAPLQDQILTNVREDFAPFNIEVRRLALLCFASLKSLPIL